MRIVKDGHPLEAVNKVACSLLIIAVDQIRPTDRVTLQAKARRLLRRDILRYPADMVLTAVKRYWIMYITSPEVGELIGKILEMESLLLGGPSVLSQLALLESTRPAVNVYYTIWHKDKEQYQLLTAVPIKDTAPCVVHLMVMVAGLFGMGPEKVEMWEVFWNEQRVKNFDTIPEGQTPQNPLKLVIPANVPLPEMV